MATAAEKLAATVGKFPAPSLQCVLAELEREIKLRLTVYPRLIESGRLTEEQGLFQQRCMEEALDLLKGKAPVIDPGHVSRTPDPGEPCFTLLGRDAAAPQLVRSWCWLRSRQIREGAKPASDEPKVTAAMRIADAMEQFRKRREARKVKVGSPEEAQQEMTS